MLSLAEIQSEMSGLKEWSVETNAITKIFPFNSFKEALEFLNKVGEIAEKHQHHPDVIITKNNLKLTLTTHSIGALTKQDFNLAREIDML